MNINLYLQVKEATLRTKYLCRKYHKWFKNYNELISYITTNTINAKFAC